MNEETRYQPLTKKVIVEGKEKIVCSFTDIDNLQKLISQCPIHTDTVCIKTSVWNAILKQLHTFEEVYMQSDEQDKEVEMSL